MPTLVSSTSGQIPDTTSHVPDLPPSYTAGDFLVIVLAVDGAASVSGVTAGWTNVSYTGGLNVSYKTATGSDALTVTLGNAEGLSYVSYAFNGADTLDGIAGSTQFVTTAIDPPALTLSEERNAIWMAVFKVGAAANVTAFPADYTLSQTSVMAATATYDSLAVGLRALTATTEDPGTFTTSASESGNGYTLAVYQSVVAVPTTMSYWTGSVWSTAPLMRWNGAAWVAAPAQRWNGSAWVPA